MADVPEGLTDTASRHFLAFWDYNLITFEHHSLTPGKIIISVAIIVGGFIIANIVRRRLKSYLVKKRKISAHGATVLDKLVYYAIILTAFLMALRVVHIPLTMFTFLGGALAVGLGFGLKNLMNNFIGGFILLTEKPVKVGDVIEIENSIGIIEDIGIRSTRIHTEGNIHIMLPNSDLLDKKVIDWTRSDNYILTHVVVGISYDSDVHQATDVMLEALKNLDFILPEFREPFVLFWDYGDSSLVFKIYFAIQVENKLERWQKESNVRYAVWDALKAADIVIAFPQRDVHLDTSEPLELRISRHRGLSPD